MESRTPGGPLTQILAWSKTACAILVLCAATAIALPAQTFTSLLRFNGTDGANPNLMVLVQGSDGNLYGTTSSGGANGYGTVFKITPVGALTILHSFAGYPTDGACPFGPLVLGTDGDFYGATTAGGASTACAGGCGTIFKITSGGTLSTLHSFDGTDGGLPYGGLVQPTDGNLYGTTVGYPDTLTEYGTVFKMTLGGTLTILHNFCTQTGCTDGGNPVAGVIQATDGNFYGTTYAYGAGDDGGTVFRITSGGTLTTLYSFCSQPGCTDGRGPFAALVQATSGDFYGTTLIGGATDAGTVFKITSGGTLTMLHSFDWTDGRGPTGALVQATDGSFYGTTGDGGVHGEGTIFRITSGSTLATLHSFDSTDGKQPNALVQATSGTFYGAALNGGAFEGYGTVFSLAVGLGPFVQTLPTSGVVGTSVIILGTNLTGATSVTFNGTAATFTVVSDSEITATVPAGATTGKVEVTTPGGTLSSNVTFRVTAVISSFSPTSGPVGTVVTITGQSLTGATSVSFGGIKATSFAVNSDTQITATVPAGARTGKIFLTTPGGTVSSAGTFTVN
jgi:uncharacterized repeat protein (TIGR03803 family)